MSYFVPSLERVRALATVSGTNIHRKVTLCSISHHTVDSYSLR